MHFGREDFYPLPATIEQAFSEAKVLAVEVDISRIDANQMLQSVMKHGRLPIETTLKSTLSPSVYSDLELACKSRGIPVSAFERFQPWFAALQFIEFSLRSSPLNAKNGVDLHFIKRAGDKRLDELESFEGQLQIFSRLTPKEQEAFLAQTLRDLQGSNEQLHKMAAAWRQGDLEELYNEMIVPLRKIPEGRALYQAMFVERNLGMANRIERYLAGEEPVFVVVGAAHLLGEDGIVALLQKRGHKVDRVSPSVLSRT